MTFLPKWILTMTFCTALSAQAAPIFNLFELGVQPAEKTEQYHAVGLHNITTSLAEESGTLAMYSAAQKDNPNLVYMFEIYADDAAYQTHIQSPQYRAFLQASPSILTDHKKRILLEPQFLADKKIEQRAETINNLVIVEVKPEFNDAFKALVLPEMAQSIKVESGVLAMYAATEKDQPNRWYFYEIYADEHAYQLHRRTPHFQEYLTKSAEMLQDKQAVPITPNLLRNKGGLNFNVLETP
ncbi:antibiotic biosynthesis monooxygenase [Chelonobacter oris]|uniref:Antibiotic biosynthesis monooxygenase n=1 Tax=Chelonobacter oris TaxID=505317 RepID=A0A0A3AN87_9PAST|nr:antibiotic biosynthesis monooxygenase [Chelonobacter oris]KGQ70888.1 antibiotic biosynthesis monooxygenase [Chelonobacter oris]